MPLEYLKTLSGMTIRSLKPQTIGASHCVELLAKVCHALFTKIALKHAETLKKEVNFV